MSLNKINSDKLREYCGVFGIWNYKDAAALTILGLHALQHRGQEGAGVVSYDGKSFHSKRRSGLVFDHFSRKSVLDLLQGNSAIGHNRYSTSGESVVKNIQPFFGNIRNKKVCIAHNGNLSNGNFLRRKLIDGGNIFHSDSDTEIILHLMAKSSKGIVTEKIKDALKQIEGGYALVFLTEDSLIGVRDPNGIRKLVIGKLKNSFILASETCALDLVGAKYVREVKNGEMVVINKKGLTSVQVFKGVKEAPCIFEYIYFSRPDSIANGKSFYEYRKQMGKELAKESKIKADLVIPVPDSAVPAAIGFAEESGIPFDMGITRNHYTWRTFISPTQEVRDLSVKLKHNANKQLIKGKKVVLIDDSVVRGTTLKKIAVIIKDAGAKEVHLKSASPQIKHSDYFGIDIPDKDQLFANKFSPAKMINYLKADSMQYLSIEGLYRALDCEFRDKKNPQFTDHYFTGKYILKPKD